MQRSITFEHFMSLVDKFIAVRTDGLVSLDLPDYPYRDAYDTGEGAKATAARAIRAAKE